MRLDLDKFGLSRRRVKTLVCFAAFWIGLQVLFVTLMLDWNSSGADADYAYDCLRDIERIRFALVSIVRFLCEAYTGTFLVFIVFKRFRQGAKRRFATGLCLTATMILSQIVTNIVVENRLAKATENAAPLIVAVEKYEKEVGHPPETLQLLVPKFISAIPRTGVGPAQFEYATSEKHRWFLFLTFIFRLPVREYSLVYLADGKYTNEHAVSVEQKDAAGDEPLLSPPKMLGNWAFMDISDDL